MTVSAEVIQDEMGITSQDTNLNLFDSTLVFIFCAPFRYVLSVMITAGAFETRPYNQFKQITLSGYK